LSLVTNSREGKLKEEKRKTTISAGYLHKPWIEKRGKRELLYSNSICRKGKKSANGLSADNLYIGRRGKRGRRKERRRGFVNLDADY